MGEEKDLKKLTLEVCKTDHAKRYQPRRAILGVAGNIANFDQFTRTGG